MARYLLRRRRRGARAYLYAQGQMWLPLACALGQADERLARPAWSESAVVRLHCALLERSLRHLFDPRSGPETRAEIWRWIEARGGVDRAWAFSFQACCQIARVDPVEMRDRIVDAARRGAGEGARAERAGEEMPVVLEEREAV